MYGPCSRNNMRKNYTNGCRLDYMAIGFIVISACSLNEAFGHKRCLVPLKRAINIVFVFENPLTSNNFGSTRKRC